MRRIVKRLLLGTAVAVVLIAAISGGAAWVEQLVFPPPDVSFVDIVSDAAPLTDDFRSYACIDTVRREIEARGLSIHLEKRSDMGRRGLPPHMIVSYVAQPYSLLGLSGTIAFSFFNNRLMMVTFTPANGEEFVTKLVAHHKITLVPNERGVAVARVGPHTRVVLVTRSGEPTRIEWIDERLYDEQALWIKHFA